MLIPQWIDRTTKVIHSGAAVAPYVILDSVVADTFRVWFTEFNDIRSGSELIKYFESHPIDCSAEKIASALTNQNAIIFNNVAFYLATGLVDYIADLRAKHCEDVGQLSLEMDIQVFQELITYLITVRSDIKSNADGHNLALYLGSEQMGDNALTEIQSAILRYNVLLAEPCIGPGGQPLDNRLGGQLDLIDLYLDQLVYVHGELKRLFRL